MRPHLRLLCVIGRFKLIKMSVDRFITLEEAAKESGTVLKYMEEVCNKNGIDVFYYTNDKGEDSKCVKLSDYVEVFGWGS